MKKDLLNKEVEIIRKCQNGDRKAQFVLYQQYAKAMLNVAYRILRNEEAAKDVLQLSFLKAFDRLGTLKNHHGFGGWLKKIVVRTAINQLKKKGLNWVPISDQLIHEYENTPTPASIDFDLELAKSALMDLPTGYRTVLSLYLIEGYDHEEISSILGISKSTSLTQYARGKNKLRAIIKKRKQDGSY